MNWLNTIVDELVRLHPEGELLIESGGSPSGSYHIGHMRELVTCDAIMLELRRRGRQAKHVYFSDDLDALRKIPVNIPEAFSKYLGLPLSDVPAPDGSDQSYGQFFIRGLMDACDALGIEVEFIDSHREYRSGFFVPAIEKVLAHVPEARKTLESVAGRQLDENWTPIQVLENSRLKNRKFVAINTDAKTVTYEDNEGKQQDAHYDTGEVKLDWRLDWPARWWLLKVTVEPFGRDHASAGGSFDTGVEIMKNIYKAPPPLPVPYDFINMAGDTKKMSASKGTGLDAIEGSTIMPPEVVRYFILRSPPAKRLYFDPVNSVVQLMDEFAALVAKPDKTKAEQQLLDICTLGKADRSVSQIPFSHLVASYQAALKDSQQTLDVLRRTEHAKIVESEQQFIKAELKFIDEWLKLRAPDSVKFELVKTFDGAKLSAAQKKFLKNLAEKVQQAPSDADGEWFHKAIYDLKDTSGLEPKELFTTLYRALIAKDAGPRAGWFLSILPHDWLIERLELKK